MKRTEELKKIPERFVEEAFVLGITSKLKLLVMHSQSNEFVELPPGQIQNISNKHPAKAMVIVQHAPKVKGYYQGDHHIQELTYRDLWFYASDYYFFEEPEKPTTLEIIENNNYWKGLKKIACRALEKYEILSKNQIKVPSVGDVEKWIEKEITTNTREIQIIKNVLKSEFNF